MENCTVVMYDDYPNGYPYCEDICIKRCKEITKTICIGSDFDPQPFREYVQKKLNRYPNELKPNHYADFLGVNLLDSLYDVYGLDLDRAMKIDTDYFITSKFILRDIFRINESIIGVDNGYLLHYLKPVPTQYLNMHMVYEVKGDELNKDITTSVFNSYLDEYWRHKHYTSTGPYMLNKELSLEFNSIVPTPWCTDPSGFAVGHFEVKHPISALGYHFQSSVFKDFGFKVNNIKLDGEYITYDIEEL